MPMAPHTSVFLGLFLAMLAVSARASPTRDEIRFQLAQDKFLRACCTDTTEAALCYDSLLPRARSFEGNLVKVTTAATIIAYEQLRSFDAELRVLLRRGIREDMRSVIHSCASYFEDAALFDEDPVLEKLRGLETIAGRRGKHARLDLTDVHTAISTLASSTGLLCMKDFISIGNGVLASPVGKMMVAGNATVTTYGEITLDLVASIKL